MLTPRGKVAKVPLYPPKGGNTGRDYALPSLPRREVCELPATAPRVCYNIGQSIGRCRERGAALTDPARPAKTTEIRQTDGATLERDGRTGQIVGSQSTTPRQDRFISLVADGLNSTAAAQRVGYRHPKAEGWRLTKTPHVMAAIRRRQDDLLIRGRGVSRRYLVSVVLDENAAPAHRLKAAIALESIGQATDAASRDAAREEKGMSDMSLAELEALSKKFAKSIEKIVTIGSSVTLDQTPTVPTDAAEDS